MDFDDLDDMEEARELDSARQVAERMAAEHLEAERRMASAAEEAAQVHPSAERCRREFARPSRQWSPVGPDVLMANHNVTKKGMRYDIEFPYTPELITRMGPVWLTSAFRLAGTLEPGNKVKRIVGSKPITGGGAAAKIMLEVEYEKPSPELHNKLFIKYPYPYAPPTTSDRMNSSIMLQQDCPECDAVRLLEAFLPFKTPKYYYSDISNETTNFIIITEFINYGDPKKKREDFKPFEVEPPYEKFLDDEQWTNPMEYYTVWTQALAKMAGWYKAGRIWDKEELGKFFMNSKYMLPQTGMPEREFIQKIGMGEQFIAHAKHLFPPAAVTDRQVKEWKRVLNIVAAYQPEIAYLAHMDDDYLALAHGNMNADNTWWWRDEEGKLQIGVLDWGGLSCGSLPQKLWWSFYAAEFHMLDEHLDELLDTFITSYAEAGGPTIDRAILRRDFMFAALNQCVGLLGAVPQIWRAIKKPDWASIKDRHDPRLKGSFLTRMYVQGFVLILTMLEKYDLGQMVDDFLKMPGITKKKLPTLP